MTLRANQGLLGAGGVSTRLIRGGSGSQADVGHHSGVLLPKPVKSSGTEDGAVTDVSRPRIPQTHIWATHSCFLAGLLSSGGGITASQLTSWLLINADISTHLKVLQD